MVALLVSAGLLVTLWVAGLEAASQLAGVVGTLLTAAGLVVSVVAFFRAAPGPPLRRVRGGAAAVGGDANGAALGEGSQVAGPAPARTPGGGGGSANVKSGRHGIGVGGDANDAALGKRSKRTRS
ncbi:hypothetical protein ACIPMU_35700 [Streptomyces cyaneofuscatus]|uniref:hypothetical protein n=1 Tax=Streptomyces cyaneofuscatus TaxID=66883 RepID=UPI003828F10B